MTLTALQEDLMQSIDDRNRADYLADQESWCERHHQSAHRSPALRRLDEERDRRALAQLGDDPDAVASAAPSSTWGHPAISTATICKVELVSDAA
jgi:hypothetical protein